MSFLGNIFSAIPQFVGDSVGEIASHPMQALGAAAGVPGYDPFFGGLFNNQNGGALLSPTGNFTSSAWQNMYQNDPGSTGALNMFNGINSVADKVAPAIAGGFAAPGLGAAFGAGGAGSAGALGAMGTTGAADAAGSAGAGLGGAGMGTGAGLGSGLGAGATWGGASAAPVIGSGTSGLFTSGAGAGGLGGLLGGPAAVGDAGLTGAVGAGGSGLGSLMGGGADLGGALGSAPTGLFSGLLPGGGMSGTASGALGGGLSGATAGASPLGGATMGGFTPADASSTMNQGQKLLQMQQQMQQQQQQNQPRMAAPAMQQRFGNPAMRNGNMQLGPSMSYASMPMNNQFGFGG